MGDLLSNSTTLTWNTYTRGDTTYDLSLQIRPIKSLISYLVRVKHPN
jgi:hypothetical protein